MIRFLLIILCTLSIALGADAPLVLLDIGHSATSGGAASPDRKICENSFWYRYAPVIKNKIEQQGYRCELVNRGVLPTKEAEKKLALQYKVVQLNDKDTGKRYPSKYHKEWIGAGMVSADYGISRRPACMVFLHLNSTGDSWTNSTPTGLVISDASVGIALSQAICDAISDGMGKEQGGGRCRILVRDKRSQNGAGWVNTLAAEKIPAAVIESLYINSRVHYNIITDNAKATRFAECVADGIINWLHKQKKQVPEKQAV